MYRSQNFSFHNPRTVHRTVHRTVPGTVPSPVPNKIYRCNSKNYCLGQSCLEPQSQYTQRNSRSPSITESDLLKYEDLNIDLKELNVLFNDLNKKATQKQKNLSKLLTKKRNTSTNRNRIEQDYITEENKITKNIKKILSEKLREKALQRLNRLIKKPKEKRLNKVACAISALLEVLHSCGALGVDNRYNNYEKLINMYQNKIRTDYSTGNDAAIEFLNNILEKKDTGLKDFISKQLTHNKKLGEVLKTTVKELPTCAI